MRLTWLGHSCVLLQGTQSVIVDPFTSSHSIPCSPDIVALTHGHDDHLGDTIRLKATTIAINETAKILAKKGIETEGMNIGGTIQVKGISFTMTPAIHSGGLEMGGTMAYGGGACGYVITMDGLKVYHAGDTAIFSDMQLIGELYCPDIALLPIGDRFTMGPREAMMAARFIGAPLIIPIHYNTWPRIQQNPQAFKHAIERTTDLQVAVLKPGETLNLDLATLRKKG